MSNINLEHFSTRLPEGTKKYLKVYAAKEGMVVQEVVAKIFKEWIYEQNKKEGNK